MAIGQGSIIDHVNKPAIHPDDAIVQSITATESGKIDYTVNGVTVNKRVEPRGLIKCDGHATNHISIADGVRSGQEVFIQETGDTANTPLIVRNSSDSAVALIFPGETASLRWYWTSTTAGAWLLTDQHFAPVKTYNFDSMPITSPVDGTAAGTTDGDINGHLFADGLILYARAELAQAINKPEPVANVGVKWDGDDADNHGFELALAYDGMTGITGRSKFVGGTVATNAPGFYAQAEFSCNDISNLETVAFGLGLVEAMPDAALVTARDTYVAFAKDDGDDNLDIKEEVDGSSAGSDDSGTDLADDATGGTTAKIAISDSGAVTYTLNGANVAESNGDFQLVANDSMTVFFNFVKTAAAAGGLIIKSLKIGYS